MIPLAADRFHRFKRFVRGPRSSLTSGRWFATIFAVTGLPDKRW